MKHLRERGKPAQQASPATTAPITVVGSETPPAAGRNEDQIRQTAYALYEARHCEGGHELEDWLQAEAMVCHA